MSKKIRAVIFDLDGTLVNAYPAIIQSFRYTMNAVGVKAVMSDRAICRAVGWGDRHLLRPFVPPAKRRKAILVYRRHHAKAIREKARLVKGAGTLLKKLKKKKYCLCVASNRPTRFSHILLKSLGIEKDFEIILCGDRIKRAKPHPDMLMRICRRLKLPVTRAVFVGDMTVDVQAGKRAGMRTIAVATGSSTKSELKKAKPYQIIDNVARVYTIVEYINSEK